MRLTRIVCALVGAGLLSLPVLVAAPAQAANTYATRLSVQRQPSLQLYNNIVQVGALLEREATPGAQDWTPVDDAQQEVTLERRLAGSTTYTQLATRTLDAEGITIFTTTAVANAYYRVRFTGGDYQGVPDEDLAPSLSSTVGVKVARNLGAKAHRIRGPKFRFFGKVTPSYARHKIVLQKKLGSGVWRTIASQRTTRYSRWSFVVFARPTRGVVRYRTFTPAGTKFVKSYSGIFKITTI